MTKSNGTSATLDTIAEDLLEDQASGVMTNEDFAEELLTARYQDRREERYQALVAKLDQPLDPTLVKTRKGYGDGDSATKLSYLAHHTVTRQLNRIFGYGRWSVQVTEVKDFFEEGSGVPRAVRVTVNLSIEAPSFNYAGITSMGYSVVRGKKGSAPSWAAYEMAVGNAEAKAFKRAASKYGPQFGLDLYGDDEAEPEELDLERENTTTTKSFKAEIVNGVAHCQNCNADIKGYTRKSDGKVYTTEDLVAMSKKFANGRILCLDCRQKVNQSE